MPVVRFAVLLLLVASGVFFAMYAFTGQVRYRRWGLVILKWTLAAGLAFFAILIAENLAQ